MKKSLVAISRLEGEGTLPITLEFNKCSKEDIYDSWRIGFHIEEPEKVMLFSLARAAERYAWCQRMGGLADTGFAVAETADGYIAEWESGRGTAAAVSLTRKEDASVDTAWEIKAAVFRKGAKAADSMAALRFSMPGFSTECVWFALLPSLMENEAFRNHYVDYALACADANIGVENRSAWMAALGMSSAAKDVLTARGTPGSARADVEMTGPEMLAPGDVDGVEVKKIHAGSGFSLYNTVKSGGGGKGRPGAAALKKEWTVAALKGAFARNPGRVLTDAERLMVQDTEAKLGAWYRVPRQVVKAAVAAKETYGKDTAFSNFYFYGEAGGGKTSAAMALSLALGIPYVAVTFSANTEIIDLLQSIAPETVDREGRTRSVGELAAKYPDAVSCAADPAASYEAVTGVRKDDATPEEATAAVFERISAEMEDGGQRFKYVDSPLAKAFRFGYLCELQEPNVVANPGVVVGLNALLDRTAVMVCADGETVRRHPDFVAVDTTNRSYAACRDVNASHLSRFHMALKFDRPEEEEAVRVVKANTGFADEVMIKKMLHVQEAMRRVLKDSGQENWSCGTRELCNWVAWYMVLGDAYEAAMDTIVPLSTQSWELEEDLVSCLCCDFQPKG